QPQGRRARSARAGRWLSYFRAFGAQFRLCATQGATRSLGSRWPLAFIFPRLRRSISSLCNPGGDALASLALAPGFHISAPSALNFVFVQPRGRRARFARACPWLSYFRAFGTQFRLCATQGATRSLRSRLPLAFIFPRLRRSNSSLCNPRGDALASLALAPGFHISAPAALNFVFCATPQSWGCGASSRDLHFLEFLQTVSKLIA